MPFSPSICFMLNFQVLLAFRGGSQRRVYFGFTFIRRIFCKGFSMKCSFQEHQEGADGPFVFL